MAWSWHVKRSHELAPPYGGAARRNTLDRRADGALELPPPVEGACVEFTWPL
jgi:hypothetical protein